MLETLVQSVLEIGYAGFFFYMVIVGTFIPLPTQLLLLPVGYLISIGKLDFTMVALITAAGTTTGALINYIFAQKIITNVFGKKKEHLLCSIEDFFKRYGKAAVLLAPLIPSLGQYISLPAGLSRMPLVWFLPITYISNLCWNVLMIGIGYVFGADSNAQADKIIAYLSLAFIFLLVIYLIMRYTLHRDKMRKLNSANS